MRKLTRDQIFDIIGYDNKFDSITIYINKVDIKLRKGYSYLFQKGLAEEHKSIVLKWHKRELERLPDEARQHVEYLTCHPTVIAEISFPDKNMDGNKMPLCNAGLGGGIASKKPPSGAW